MDAKEKRKETLTEEFARMFPNQQMRIDAEEASTDLESCQDNDVSMKASHKSALNRLQKALDNCHRVGLTGGVYDCSFYVWPADAPDPRDEGRQFFVAIRNVGGDIIRSLMILDGGSGV